jgi:hypothetical protein
MAGTHTPCCLACRIACRICSVIATPTEKLHAELLRRGPRLAVRRLPDERVADVLPLHARRPGDDQPAADVAAERDALLDQVEAPPAA